MSRYTKEQIEDVARLLNLHTLTRDRDLRTRSPGGQAIACLASDFAGIFAADNPPACIHCGDPVSTTVPCTTANGRTYDEHLFEGGFNRERFLAACGLEPVRDPGWPNGECPTCGRTDDHTTDQCNLNLAALEPK